jgi:hypothetical protein
LPEEAGTDKVVLYVGNQDWPLPIPVAKKQGVWRFDATEGKEELLARWIGRNELSAIQVCLAYVDAQREYAMKDRDGDGLLEYAQKFGSDPGKKMGCTGRQRRGMSKALSVLWSQQPRKRVTRSSSRAPSLFPTSGITTES